jgi:hypothetical protein
MKWGYGMFYDKREIYQALEVYKGSENMRPKYFYKDNYNELYYRLEADFFNSLKIVFFPLLGLVLPWFIPEFRKASLHDELAILKKLWFVSFVIFILGYMIVFCFHLNRSKWEFSRFMILGYATASICFIASLNILLKHISQRKSWLIISIVMFVMAFGQVSFVISQIKKNVFGSWNNELLPFPKRFKMLVNLSGTLKDDKK